MTTEMPFIRNQNAGTDSFAAKSFGQENVC